MIAEVVVNYKSKSVDSVFDYAVPEDMENTIQIGSCVTVPFGKGNRVFEAYVTAIKDSSKAKNLKQILKFSKDICLFDEKQLELIKWMRDKYLVTYLDAIHAVTPPGTGVMASTIGSTSSKATSPQSLPSAFTLIPTSMIV